MEPGSPGCRAAVAVIHSRPQGGVDFSRGALAVRSGVRTVTSIDRSRSCPQECAQPGEISCPPGDPRSRQPGRRPHGAVASPRRRLGAHRALSCGDSLSGRRGSLSTARCSLRPPVPFGRRSITGCGRTGGNHGRGRGEAAASVHSRRVVHVSTQQGRRPPTAGQQGHLGPHLQEEPRSPASTPVMTRMRDLFQGVLEPHSGWGTCLGAPLERLGSGAAEGQKGSWRGQGFPHRGISRHDEP